MRTDLIGTDPCALVPAYIRSIAPYQPGKPISELERELGITDIIKLASNENPLGPSPKAVGAAHAAVGDAARYPDGNGFALKAALSAYIGIASEAIVLGNGSNDVIELVARAFLSSGTSAVFSQHAFAVYPLVSLAQGASLIEVPAQEYGHDLAAMRAAVRADTRVIFVANPNNPTGTLIAPDELHVFIKSIDPNVIIVLDEAYREYLPEELKSDSVGWLAQHKNLVITRTFSKAYGLAGLRVGYALAAAEVADVMNRIRQPFNVNAIAQAAATAALADEDFLLQSVMVNVMGMKQLGEGLRARGIDFIPSYGNFVAFAVDNAQTVFEALLREGVIVRPIANYGMPEFLRVSIGLERENMRFLSALDACLTPNRSEVSA